MSESPTSSNIILGKKALINIDNSKKLTTSSKLCNSKKNSHATKYFAKYSFLSSQFISWQFLYCPRVFILKSQYWLTVLLLKWNKTFCIDFFCQFCQVVEHQAIRVWSFSQSFKVSLFNDDKEWAENTIQCCFPGGS